METSASTTVASRNDTHTLQRAGFIAFALIAAAYVIVLGRLTEFPFQDFPNHLTRATIMADLLFHHGERFGQLFEYSFLPVPYILGDLILAAIVAVLGPTPAGVLWNTMILLSWPAALAFFAHVIGLSRNARLFLLFLSLFLATDWFFLLGFTQFRLGMALMIVAFGVAHLLRLRWSATRFTAFCALLIAGYFTHLVFVIFLAPALIVSGAVKLYFRRTTVRTELKLIAPVLGVMLWHFGFADRLYRSQGPEDYGWLWGTVGLKLSQLQFDFLRFGSTSSKLLMVLLTVVVGWGLWRDLRWKKLLRPEVLEMLALAFTFLCIYFVLPSRYSQAAYVDVRALMLISLFVILARIFLADRSLQPAAAVAIPLAAVLAILNLAYLSMHLSGNDAWMNEYRAIISRIPPGSAVLPVYAGEHEGGMSPRLHAPAYAVMDRTASMPYLFSGDAGHPMKYFRYRHRLYGPNARWYSGGVGPMPVDWRAIACSYQFMLVGKPFDMSRIPLRTSTVAENGSAALLEVSDNQNEARSCLHQER